MPKNRYLGFYFCIKCGEKFRKVKELREHRENCNV